MKVGLSDRVDLWIFWRGTPGNGREFTASPSAIICRVHELEQTLEIIWSRDGVNSAYLPALVWMVWMVSSSSPGCEEPETKKDQGGRAKGSLGVR